jgi:hypothetical protein
MMGWLQVGIVMICGAAALIAGVDTLRNRLPGRRLNTLWAGYSSV